MRSIRRLLAPLRIRRQQRRALLKDNKQTKALNTSRAGYDVFQNESGGAGGGRGTTSDETSSTEGSRLTRSSLSPSSVPSPSCRSSPWKAENFLENGRINESDWWTTTHDSEGEQEITVQKLHEENVVVGGDHDNHDEEQDEHDNDQTSLASAGGTTPSLSESAAPSASSARSSNNKKKFVNQGLALWEQGREAWKSSATTPPSRRRDPAAIPDSFKRDLVKCLGDKRHFELSQRIPLSTMIDAYQQVWENERNGANE